LNLSHVALLEAEVFLDLVDETGAELLATAVHRQDRMRSPSRTIR
jgi:hypothetical protein